MCPSEFVDRPTHVLVAEGNTALRTELSERIGRPHRQIQVEHSSRAAWRAFETGRSDLVVAGTRLPGGGAIALARRIRATSAVPILLLTDRVDAKVTLEALRIGVSDLLCVPDEIDRIDRRVNELLLDAVPSTLAESVLIGSSAAMREARSRLQAMADLDVAVAITGEHGTGKVLVARALHARSSRRAEPFARVAPADAEHQAPAAATIVLDHIDEFSTGAQRAWAARMRVSAGEEACRRARIVATAAPRIELLAASSALDPLLASQISTYGIHLPPLRERLEDLSDLVPFLVRRAGASIGRPHIRISRPAIARLQQEQWLGNVRELDLTVTRLAAFARAGVVDLDGVNAVLSDRADLVSALRHRRELDRREELRRILSECEGNFAEAARRLGLTRGAVVHRAKRYGLFDANRSSRRNSLAAKSRDDRSRFP